jgi:hypothetical protein
MTFHGHRECILDEEPFSHLGCFNTCEKRHVNFEGILVDTYFKASVPMKSTLWARHHYALEPGRICRHMWETTTTCWKNGLLLVQRTCNVCPKFVFIEGRRRNNQLTARNGERFEWKRSCPVRISKLNMSLDVSFFVFGMNYLWALGQFPLAATRRSHHGYCACVLFM